MNYLFAPPLHHNSIYYGRILKNMMELLEANCSHSLYEVLPRGVQVWLPGEQLGVYPDITVIAGEPFFHDGRSNQVTNPCLLFEIVAERTSRAISLADRKTDQKQLFNYCQTIPYLQEYVLIYQQAPRVERLYRTSEHGWALSTYTSLADMAELNITGTFLPLREIYKKVAFERLD